MQSEPIFVKVRNDKGEVYGSYLFFWELVELSGFPICELDEVDKDSSSTYIFAPNNGNVEACCKREHTAKYILWQLEIPGIIPPTIPDCFDEQWVSDRYYADLVNKTMGQLASEDPVSKNQVCKYVTIGGHPGFGWDASNDEKQYDFVHMAYIYGKRAQQVAELEAKGYTMAPVGFGEQRNQAIAKSKWGLCLHQHDIPVLEPLRHTMLSLFNIPLVIEHCNDPFPYLGRDYITFLNHGPDEVSMRANADINYKLLTQELTFRKCVEAAL